MAITKVELVERLAKKCGLTKVKTTEIIDLFLETITDCLKEDGAVKLHGFGRFQVKTMKERMGRNHQNGQEYMIPEHKKVRFYSGKMLDSRIKGN